MLDRVGPAERVVVLRALRHQRTWRATGCDAEGRDPVDMRSPSTVPHARR
jgi:hypothetical protein